MKERAELVTLYAVCESMEDELSRLHFGYPKRPRAQPSPARAIYCAIERMRERGEGSADTMLDILLEMRAIDLEQGIMRLEKELQRLKELKETEKKDEPRNPISPPYESEPGA